MRLDEISAGPDPRLRGAFLARTDGCDSFLQAFEHLPDLCLFVKDRQGRFVLGNRALLALLGVKDERALVGRRDPDFFPPDLCEIYARDDETVLRTGRPLVDKLEIVRNPDGTLEWHNTTKFPIRDRAGEVIGVGGITRDLKKMHSTHARFLHMAPVMEAILNDYAEPLSIRDLAARAGLSVSQFERQFKKRFRTTPLKYILQVRLKAACQLLAQSDLSVASIAAQTGFCDQSHFTRHFVRHKGMTPTQYRRGYAAPPAERP